MHEETYSSRRPNLIFIFLLLLDLFFLTSHLNTYIKTFKNFLFYVFNPVPAAAEKVVTSGNNLLRTITEIVAVHQENTILKKELERFAYLQKDYAGILEENERLKKSINMGIPSKTRPVVARVVVRESGSWYEWITIDKGYDDSLFVDAPVLVWVGEKMVVLGRVWEVYKNSSKVILLSNTLCSIPVEVRELKEDGLIVGQNNAALRLNYLVAESNIKPGDEIVTSPISQVFPPGITVGYVQSVSEVSKNNTMKMAVVKPAFNTAALKLVAILVPQEKTR